MRLSLSGPAEVQAPPEAPTHGPVDQLQTLWVLAHQGRLDVLQDVAQVVQRSGHHGRALGQGLQLPEHPAQSLAGHGHR